MARTISPICKKCRRLGEKLFLKGERCHTPKCSFVRRSYAPGEHGQRRSRITDYGIQLREKQRAKNIYGVLEKQFRSYYDQMNKGRDHRSLLEIIETRLDNVVFRLGLATSRRDARQMIGHGKFLVNNKKMDIPSYQVKVGDKISFKKESKENLKDLKNNIKRITPVSWLKFYEDKGYGEVTSLSKKEDVGEGIQERLIIEFYSR